jgi:PhnO protein
MKNAFTIRPAKNHDAKRIFHFLCQLGGHLFDQQEFEINYRRCLSNNNNIYLVAANANNDAIGFISCHGQILLHHGNMIFEVQELFVMDSYRKKGVWKKLLHGIDESLTERDQYLLPVAANKKRTEMYTRTQKDK